MARLRDQLVNFIASLRDAGVRISVAESLDAMNAVAAVGLERARMHEALAAALIKDEADRAIFDESFNRFFASPRADRGVSIPINAATRSRPPPAAAAPARIRRRATNRRRASRKSHVQVRARTIALRNHRRRKRSHQRKMRRRTAR